MGAAGANGSDGVCARPYVAATDNTTNQKDFMAIWPNHIAIGGSLAVEKVRRAVELSTRCISPNPMT